MAYARHLHASVSRRAPRALATCDLCGRVINHDTLTWQMEWRGPRLTRTGFLRCTRCVDEPNPGLRTFIIPPDPVPVQNPRPGEYSTMVFAELVMITTDDGIWIVSDAPSEPFIVSDA
jgi:hypothetical protein